MLDSLLTAALYLADGVTVLYLALGVLVGLLFGITPGLGGATAIALLPVAKSLVLLFGPPAFFMLAVLGLLSLTISNSNMLKGLVAAALGLFVGFVGYDDMGGTLRFTAGIDYLWDGIKLVPALIGLFAIAEMIRLMVDGGTIAKTSKEAVRVEGTLDGFKAVLRNPRTVVSGSLIGTLVGVVPGVGSVQSQ